MKHSSLLNSSLDKFNAIKFFFLISLVGLMILMTNCQKETKIQFGETQNNFVPDSIYKASTDGFLYIDFVFTGAAYGFGDVVGKIYCDKTSNPSTMIGLVYTTSTRPIKQNDYWKVVKLTNDSLAISWTPIN